MMVLNNNLLSRMKIFKMLPIETRSIIDEVFMIFDKHHISLRK